MSVQVSQVSNVEVPSFTEFSSLQDRVGVLENTPPIPGPTGPQGIPGIGTKGDMGATGPVGPQGPAGIGLSDLKSFGLVALDRFATSSSDTDDQMLSNALSYIGAQTYRPNLVLSNRSYTFNSTYPLSIDGLSISGPPGGTEREFRKQCVVNVRNANGLFAVSGANKGFSIKGISFVGNGNYWMTPTALDNSGAILTDMNISEIGWVGFKTVMQNRHLRVNIQKTYCNAGTGTQFYLAGSDNYYWTQGDSYLSSTTMGVNDYYIRFAHMSRTKVGGVYITPQVSTGVLVEGSYGNLQFIGTLFDGAGRTALTSCQGPAVKVTGGAGVKFRDCWFFNVAVASATQGMMIFSGGSDHIVSGCEFGGGAAQTSFTAQNMPAIYSTVPVRVSDLSAPNGGNKILRGSIVSDDSSWTKVAI